MGRKSREKRERWACYGAKRHPLSRRVTSTIAPKGVFVTRQDGDLRIHGLRESIKMERARPRRPAMRGYEHRASWVDDRYVFINRRRKMNVVFRRCMPRGKAFNRIINIEMESYANE